MQKPKSMVGRVVTNADNPTQLFLVTGVAFDVKSGADVAHLRRIRPLPPVHVEPVPISILREAKAPNLWPRRENLTRLLARGLRDTIHESGAVFFAKTKFEEYQFRPLLKFASFAEGRLLIADEVGLGKTIEAAYILVEEIARGRASRVLVLCPAGLRNKWHEELWRRFGMSFEIADGRRLDGSLQSHRPFRIIASFDVAIGASRTAVTGSMEPIDFLIIDEVHNLIGRSGETERRKLGLALSRRSRRVVALSATPIQIAYDDLRKVLEVVYGRGLPVGEFESELSTARAANSIMKILRESRWGEQESIQIRRAISSLGDAPLEASILEEIQTLAEATSRERETTALRILRTLESSNPFNRVLTRTRKAEVGQLRKRRIINHPVRLSKNPVAGFQHGVETTGSEQQLFDEVDDILRRYFAHVHRQQLSSCLPAMLDLIRGGMNGFPVWRRGNEVVGLLESLDFDPWHYHEEKQGLSKDAIEVCMRLADRYGLLDRDTKWETLRDVLAKLNEGPNGRKAIVFTQWIPTLQYLSRRSKSLPGVRVFEVSGDDSPWKVERSLEAFKTYPESAVLFSTDMLSEGVDLQVADTLVNYDFPYNPQRVEQRIGRIDRVGQLSDIIEIHNIWVRGSIDEQVINILENRLDIFRNAMGDATSLFRIKPDERGSVELVWLDERRRSTINRLGELELFSGLVDIVDAQAREIRRQYSGSLRALVWVLVARAILLATGGQASLKEEDASLLIGPISDEDLKVITSWVGVREAGLVISEISNFRNDHLWVRLAKSPDAAGLYVPSTHPLARVAVEVNFNSFETAQSEPSILKFRSTGIPFVGGEAVVVCKYVLGSASTAYHMHAYWLLDGASARKLSGTSLTGFAEWLTQTTLSDSDDDWTVPEAIRNGAEEDFAKWQAQQEEAALRPQDKVRLESDESSVNARPVGHIEYQAVIYLQRS